MRFRFYNCSGVGYGIWVRDWFKDGLWELNLDFYHWSITVFFYPIGAYGRNVRNKK